MPEDSSGAFEGLLRAGPERTLPARGYGPACLVGDGPAGPAAARCAVNGRYWPSVSRFVNCQIVWHLLTTLFGTTGRASKRHHRTHGAK